jgi:hypothetical protein
MDTPHTPAPPREPEPPAVIRRLSETVQHPGIASTGLTTTAGGDWALLVRVKPGVKTPIAEIERQAGGHAVIYQPARPMPVARPAFPGRGE